jgi:hypothetical protein
MHTLKSVNLLVAFILELSMIGVLAYWGFSTPLTIPEKLMIGIGLPLLVTLAWGVWLAPRASHRLPWPWFAPAKIVLFLAASLAFVDVRWSMVGYTFGIVAFCSVLIELVLKKED